MATASSNPLPRPADLATLPVTCTQTIPESYLDVMGHMNVMWYTHLFSRATIALIARFGMDFGYFESHHAGIFAIETHIRYFAEVELGKTVRIHTRLLQRSAKRLHFMHFLIIEDDEALGTTGEFVSAHMDMRTRRMAPLPTGIATRFDALQAQHADLEWPAPVCGAMRADRRATPDRPA